MQSMGGRREWHHVRYHQCRSAPRREPCFDRDRYSPVNVLAVCSSMYMLTWKGIKVCLSLSILLVHQQHQHPVQQSIQHLRPRFPFQHPSIVYYLSFSTTKMYSPIQLTTFALALSGLAIAHPGETPKGYGTTTTKTKTTSTTSSKSTCSVSTIWTDSVGSTTKPVVKTSVITVPGTVGSTCSKKEVSTTIPETVTVTKTKDVVVSVRKLPKSFSRSSSLLLLN